jgi:hypothetical protein
MLFLVRFFWTISLLGFLYVLFTTYGEIQQVLLLKFGETNFALSRGQYFFFFLTFFCTLNVAILLLGFTLKKIPLKKLFIIPFSDWWAESKERRTAAMGVMTAWTWVIASTSNYFMMYWMLVVENEFHFEGGHLENLGNFLIVGYFFAASLIFPWLRFFIRNPNLLARTERE